MTRKELYDKRDDLIQKQKEEIKKYELLRKELEEKISEKYKEIQQYRNIINQSSINFSDGIQAIAYLVSQIEKEEYIIKSFPIQALKFDSLLIAKDIDQKHKLSFIRGNLICLVKKDNQSKATEEIRQKFKLPPKRHYKPSLANFEKQKDNLLFPSENYIQLCFYVTENYDVTPEELKVPYLIEPITHDDDIYLYPNYISELIVCDKKYDYIIDYIYDILSYQLDKRLSTVTLDEMLSIADTYIETPTKETTTTLKRTLHK